MSFIYSWICACAYVNIQAVCEEAGVDIPTLLRAALIAGPVIRYSCRDSFSYREWTACIVRGLSAKNIIPKGEPIVNPYVVPLDLDRLWLRSWPHTYISRCICICIYISRAPRSSSRPSDSPPSSSRFRTSNNIFVFLYVRVKGLTRTLNPIYRHVYREVREREMCMDIHIDR